MTTKNRPLPLLFAWAFVKDAEFAAKLFDTIHEKLIGTLLEPDDQAIVLCLNSTERLSALPLCLGYMEKGTGQSRVLLGFVEYEHFRAYRYVKRDGPNTQMAEIPSPIQPIGQAHWIEYLGPNRRLLTQQEAWRLRCHGLNACY